MRVFAVHSIKGGVGKTSSAVVLAHLASLAGARTLLWDLDPQCASSFYLRVKPRLSGGVERMIGRRRRLDRHVRESDFEGLDLIPADFSHRDMDLVLDAQRKPRRRLARLLRPLRKHYDEVYLDCPPSMSLSADAFFRAADVLLVPVIPTPLALRAHQQLENHLCQHAKQRPRVLPFFTMVDRRKSLHRQICERASLEHPSFLKTTIPYSSVVERMGLERAPVTAFAPRSHAALAYAQLRAEIEEARSRS
jgi:cellulose biosynthesis protein BcsQ